MDYAQIRYHFGILNRRSQAYIAYACRPWNISYSEYVLLVELYRGNGCSQDDLSRTLSVDKGLIARCVKSLEEKGYIRRRHDALDKRVKHIYVTEKGRQARDELLRISETWIQALTKDMDQTVLMYTIAGLAQAAGNAAALSWEPDAGKKGEDL